MSSQQLAITFGSAMIGRIPAIPNAHPDGYVIVEGEDYAAARRDIFALTKGDYAFDYPIDQINEMIPKWGLFYLGTVRDGVYHPVNYPEAS